MPKTRNFSDHEKRQAKDSLHIHDDINPVFLLTGSPYPSPPTNRDFVRKGFSRVRQTDNVRYTPNIQQQSDTRAPSIQAPAKPHAAGKDSQNANNDGSGGIP